MAVDRYLKFQTGLETVDKSITIEYIFFGDSQAYSL